ncbi:MAG: STAS domain-containing protein [Devosia sp.]|nr:STAS domain-containing protein [Devosia sp.]
MAQARSKSIALPAIVDLDALDPIRDELIDAVDSGPVKVNGGKVERVATNALFMLLSAAETARRNNFSFAVTHASEPFRAAVARLGLGEQFAAITEG